MSSLLGVLTMNCAKFEPPICGAYENWKRGEPLPWNEATESTRGSRRIMRSSESAIAAVFSNDVPDGR